VLPYELVAKQLFQPVFIYPIFVTEGTNIRNEIPSCREQISCENAVKECEEAQKLE
jgi:delta-aminolevulinic acid dehydratase/porphobilinogen synthase